MFGVVSSVISIAAFFEEVSRLLFRQCVQSYVMLIDTCPFRPQGLTGVNNAGNGGYVCKTIHYNDVKMNAMTSQITSLTTVYSTVYSGADQRKHQSSVSLAFVRGIHRWPVNSPHKGPVTRKMVSFDDVIMNAGNCGWVYKKIPCECQPTLFVTFLESVLPYGNSYFDDI